MTLFKGMGPTDLVPPQVVGTDTVTEGTVSVRLGVVSEVSTGPGTTTFTERSIRL